MASDEDLECLKVLHIHSLRIQGYPSESKLSNED